MNHLLILLPPFEVIVLLAIKLSGNWPFVIYCLTCCWWEHLDSIMWLEHLPLSAKETGISLFLEGSFNVLVGLDRLLRNLRKDLQKARNLC